jgi:hypothetical protein
LKDGVALPRHPQVEGEIFAGDSDDLVFCKKFNALHSGNKFLE